MGSQTNYPSYIGPVWFRDNPSRDRDNANAAWKLCSRFLIAQYIFLWIALRVAGERALDARRLAGLSRELGSNATRPRNQTRPYIQDVIAPGLVANLHDTFLFYSSTLLYSIFYCLFSLEHTCNFLLLECTILPCLAWLLHRLMKLFCAKRDKTKRLHLKSPLNHALTIELWRVE